MEPSRCKPGNVGRSAATAATSKRLPAAEKKYRAKPGAGEESFIQRPWWPKPKTNTAASVGKI